jgi:hypothetical protein
MENIDLDIENYDFDDILNLFNLDYDFGINELKQVYKVVLKTHPDKSGLDKKYFIFYGNAFKKLKKIYDYRNKYIENSKKEGCVNKQVYNINDTKIDHNIDKKELNKLLKSDNFNEWFNKTFEKVKIYDEEQDNGYDDWLKGNDGIYNGNTNRSLNEIIEQSKRESRNKALIQYKGIQDIYSGVGVSQSSLTRDKIEEYSSDMFSKLQYEDIRKAHTETVIPVTEEDYINKEKYSSVDELKRRRMESGRLITEEEAKEKLREREIKEHKTDMYRSYKMMKQMEAIKDSNNKFYASLKQLRN